MRSWVSVLGLLAVLLGAAVGRACPAHQPYTPLNARYSAFDARHEVLVKDKGQLPPFVSCRNCGTTLTDGSEYTDRVKPVKQSVMSKEHQRKERKNKKKEKEKRKRKKRVGVVHTLVNPSGYEFEVITFNTLEGVRVEGDGSPSHSWFPGYSWQIARCRRCGRQVGWKFTKTELLEGKGKGKGEEEEGRRKTDKPDTFFAVIVDNVAVDAELRTLVDAVIAL